MFCKVRHKNFTVSKHVFFFKPGFHSIYYIGTMQRFVTGENSQFKKKSEKSGFNANGAHLQFI